MGKDMALVPAKLTDKIWQWEYMEIGELLHVFWIDSKARKWNQRPEHDRAVGYLHLASKVWTLLAPSEPQVIPELKAYMVLILRVSQDYKGLGWVRYESAFMRQAASLATKNGRLSMPPSSL